MLARHLRTQKGQVAFFVILIFQVLFVFFAMVVNIGLLVHHKINLQNSVDLAAYYGAMKQAEMMSAIGHVNYQIRQSYKLLTFRYSQLGTAGVNNNNPWDWKSTPQKLRSEENSEIVPYDPLFCVSYSPFSHVNDQESYCQNPNGLVLPGIGIPSLATGIGAIFVGFQDSIKEAAERAREEAFRSCKRISVTNWFALARFVYAYKMDVRNRKQLLISLANEVSKSDPNDLDGKSIKEGVYKTLLKNLSYQNKAEIESRYGATGVGSPSETAKFEVINGLSVGDCGPMGAEAEPPGWLSEVSIYPMLAYLDANNCPAGDGPIQLNKVAFVNQTIPTYAEELGRDNVNNIMQVIQEPSGENAQTRLFKSTLGFEKNPWCMGYYGVSATATPKIPFSPLGDVKLVARAYAKPFGGRIGPWYSTTWAPGQNQSSGRKTDTMATFRVNNGAITVNESDPEVRESRRLNHSRYMGDTTGVRSKLTASQFGRVIHGTTNPKINLDWWRHLSEDAIGDKNQNGDILAWNMTVPPSMRDLEIAAIAPDNFDVSYYSIDPDFYNNYLVRLQKGYGSKFEFDIRGDLGARAMADDPALKKFSIRNQVDVVAQRSPVDVVEKLTYIVNNFAQVLTSWQGMNPYNYSLDPSRFGQCLSGEVPQDAPETDMTAGSCVSGGRTGYSVKLVDGGFINNSSNLQLGGDGIRGSVKNLPPNNF